MLRYYRLVGGDIEPGLPPNTTQLAGAGDYSHHFHLTNEAMAEGHRRRLRFEIRGMIATVLVFAISRNYGGIDSYGNPDHKVCLLFDSATKPRIVRWGG